MAIAPVNKFISVAVPVAPGEQKLYEVPTGTSALLLYAQVANVGVGTYPTCTFIQRRESRSTGNVRDIRVMKDVEIPPNDAVILIDGRMVLEKTPLVVDRILISGTQSGVSTINDVQYHEPSGIATIRTIDPHGFNVGSEITLAGIAFTCANYSGITTTIFPFPQKSYVVDSIVDSVGTSRTFTSLVGSSNSITHYYNPAIHKFIKASNNAISVTGGGHGPYTPTFAIYEPKTGICTLTIKEHDFFSGASTYSGDITGALYNAPSGILTVTTNSDPGWATGDLVKFDNGSLSFKCAMDGNTATKTYPRSTDPASRSWKKVTKVDPTNYSLNVGASPFDYFTPSEVEYSANTGIATFTIGNHSLSAGTSIRLAKASVKFVCAQDGFSAVKSYPRPADYESAGTPATADSAYNTAVNITAVTDTTITMDVGSSSYVGVHTFVPTTASTPTDVAYNPSTGVMTLTINGHGFENGDAIKIANNSITLSCTYGNRTGVSSHSSYPRSTDPISGQWISISNATTNTFDVQVGNAGIAAGETHHFQSATAGITRSVIRSGGNYLHTFVDYATNSLKRVSVTDTVNIAAGSLVFTCSQDGFSSEHGYPRATDPIFGQNVPIISADDNTISIYAGISTAGGLVAPLQMEFMASVLENSNA
tara:strand:+ start:1284 stop:3236 length:1953 start_codon:yes stop_codon:yes gene_type:complete